MKPAEIARASQRSVASAPLTDPELAAVHRQARDEEATDGATRLTLVAAAKHFGVGYRALRQAVESGRVRVREQRQHGAGTSYIFDADDLAADLAALPRCWATPDCEGTALSTTGLCPVHARVRAAHGAEEALLADPARTWLSGVEAAAAAGVSSATLTAARRRGEIPATRVGKHYRYERVDLAQWQRRWREDPRNGTEKRRGRPRRRPDQVEVERRRVQVQQLHDAGHSPGRIAELMGWSKPTILGDLDALGISRPGSGRRARVLSIDARAKRKRDAARLYVEGGKTLNAIAAELSSSATQIGRDLRAMGIELRRGGPQPLYALPAERGCLHCGELFTPRFPALGDQKFCTAACGLAARTAAREEELERRGLLGTRDVAERLGVGEGRVVNYINRGWLAAERIAFAYAQRPGWGIAPADLERFEREWARSEGVVGKHRARWLDPEYALGRWRSDGWLARFAQRKGLSLSEAEAIVRTRLEQRRSRLVRHRRGRKKAVAPSETHRRWLAQFAEVLGEMQREHEERLALDLPSEAPTQSQAAAAIAEADWREYPSDWPRDRYPAARNDAETLAPTMARPAADRVLTAIKRLQNAQTEKAAA